MSMNLFQTLKDGISHLNPNEIRDQVERPVRVGLFAPTEPAYEQMDAFFTPAALSAGRRAEIASVIDHANVIAAPGGVPARSPAFDIKIYSPDMRTPHDGFKFNPVHPERTVDSILAAHPEFAVPLARHLSPFRAPVADAIIKKIAKENAWFSLATALPDIVPLISLPWALGEFASDTAVLTANQIRMAFLLAAASDRDIGYREQRGEVASILLSAFGWRAIARELVAKIPFGGGLLPKAAIAYAGTRVAGLSLERYYRIGYGYTRKERKEAYDNALESGKTIASRLLSGLKRGQTSVSEDPGRA